MKRVLVAMSGGVDSSVAVWRLQQAGYLCSGATMRLREGAQREIDEAAAVAERLGIPFQVLDYGARFHEQVIAPFVHTYETGGTPNPCVICNCRLKFGALLDYALEQGMDYIATGHYARVAYDGASGRYLLRRATDLGKDQSYVLHGLTQFQLAHTLFPLGETTKAENRARAAEIGLRNAQKKDSQDICFIPDGDYAAFMERERGCPYPEGDFLDLQGRVVGRHRGAVRYTAGQRRGLNLAMGAPVYVCGKDMEKNTVTVGPNEVLFARTMLVASPNWIAFPALEAPLRAEVKARYSHKPQCATLYPEPDGLVRVVFDAPERALTPGQYAVFYDGDLVLGGGEILRTLRDEAEEG